jgi:DNA polymerase alpha subunit A
MSYEYSEKKLYNQLLYFAALFDTEKAKNKAKSEKEYAERRDRIVVLAETNRDRFEGVKAVVDGYLRKCGRQWVEMDTLFGFALK